MREPYPIEMCQSLMMTGVAILTMLISSIPRNEASETVVRIRRWTVLFLMSGAGLANIGIGDPQESCDY